MRKSVSRVMTLAAVVGLSAACMTGCQTSSGAKSSSSNNWFSWGKKKPASSTFASTKPDTNLPAPPSGSMTPNAAPSYAQSPATRPANGATTWPTTHPNTTAQAANPVSYGQRPDGAAAYSNATYNTASGYGARAGAAAPAAGGAPATAGAAQGFYGPAYGGGAAAAQGSYAPTYRDNRTPAAGETAYGGGAGAYGPVNHAASPPGGGRASGDPSSSAPAAYGAGGYSAATPAPAWSGGAPNAAANRASAYDTGSQNTPAGGDYGPPARTASADRGPLAAGDTAANAGSYSPATNSAASAYSGGSYRPGSTSRPTQFGTSDNINAGAADPVRRASFGAGGEAAAGTTAGGDNSAPVGGAYGSSPARTATGGAPYSYPSTYDR